MWPFSLQHSAAIFVFASVESAFLSKRNDFQMAFFVVVQMAVVHSLFLPLPSLSHHQIS